MVLNKPSAISGQVKEASLFATHTSGLTGRTGGKSDRPYRGYFACPINHFLTIGQLLVSAQRS